MECELVDFHQDLVFSHCHLLTVPTVAFKSLLHLFMLSVYYVPLSTTRRTLKRMLGQEANAQGPSFALVLW